MSFTTRPVIMGTIGMVTSTHYLSTVEGLRVLQEGGNAVDASATMWFCLSLLKPHLIGVGGECPILLYLGDEEKVIAVNGQGPAPMAASIGWFKDKGYPMIPEDGFTPACVPGAFDAWMKTLDEFGSFGLPRVLEPAIRIASEGFPIYPTLAIFLKRLQNRYNEEWPSSASIYLKNGGAPKVGQLQNNPDWARTFSKIVEVYSNTSDRSAGFDAARKYFYEGPVAHAIVEYTQNTTCKDIYGKENFGFLTNDFIIFFRIIVR